MRRVLPIFLALIGLGAGVGAGLFLRPVPDAAAERAGDAAPSEDGLGATDAEHGTDAAPENGRQHQPEYVKLNNQFVIPIVEAGRVSSMVIMALSLEVDAGSTEAVYTKEPKLRDAFLQVLFDHANAGGFRGSFTDGANLILLRKALLESAQSTLGEMVTDVLIADIARQDS